MRNNYTLNDLTKMNLKIIGIKVGEVNDLNIEFSNQIELMTNSDSVNDSGLDFDEENTRSIGYDLIDVIFSGV